jgi:uncharacterized protein
MIERETQVRIAALGLQPHPEGGFYRETYRSPDRLPAAALPHRYGGERCFCTAILFLLPQGEFSAWHRLCSDELWHFHDGAPLIVHSLDPAGRHTAARLGRRPDRQETPQLCVPAGCWFAAEPASEEPFSLVGCTVAPGFEFADFELADPDALRATFPQHAALIRRLTRT